MQIRKPSGIGGQAVIEGIMMKNKSIYAIAVRRADQSIDIKKEECHSITFFTIPFIRGIVYFIEFFYLGMRTFLYSASFYGEEEVKRKQEWEEWISTGTGRNFTKDLKKSKAMGGLAKQIKSVFNKIKIVFLMLCFIVIAVAFIFLLPMILSKKLIGLELSMEKIMIEEGLKVILFFLYFLLIAKIEDVKRIFMYHGAENKVINCIENGLELTVENVRKQLKQRRNCGTGFFFCVIFFSILSFVLIQTEVLWKKILLQILFTFLIAAVSYEWMHLTEKIEHPLIKFLSTPGLWFQKLFTKEPEDDMILVAIASIEAVFDWREFLQEYWGNHIEWKPLNEKKEDNKIESETIEEEKTKNQKEAIHIKEDDKENEIERVKTFSMLAKERLQQTILNDEYGNHQDFEKQEKEQETIKKEQEEQKIQESTYARLQPDIENEDDPILKALDKFFGE